MSLAGCHLEPAKGALEVGCLSLELVLPQPGLGLVVPGIRRQAVKTQRFREIRVDVLALLVALREGQRETRRIRFGGRLQPLDAARPIALSSHAIVVELCDGGGRLGTPFRERPLQPVYGLTAIYLPAAALGEIQAEVIHPLRVLLLRGLLQPAHRLRRVRGRAIGTREKQPHPQLGVRIPRLRGHPIPACRGAEIRERALAGEIDVAEHALCLDPALLGILLEPVAQARRDLRVGFDGRVHQRSPRRVGPALRSLLEQPRRSPRVRFDSETPLVKPSQRDLRVQVPSLRGAPIPRSRAHSVLSDAIALLVAPTEFGLSIGIAHTGLHAGPLEIPAPREDEHGCGAANPSPSPRRAKAGRRSSHGSTPLSARFQGLTARSSTSKLNAAFPGIEGGFPLGP